MGGILSSIRKFFRFSNTPEESDYLVITKVEENGFRVEGNGRNTLVSWDTVRTVALYKRDMVTWDTVICNVVFPGERESCFAQITEDKVAFKELHEAFGKHLPGYRTDWEEVVKPAFETNFTVVFERTGASEIKTK